MPKREIYVSVDIEADGPIPGHNSMLNFGAAAFDLEAPDPRRPITTFEANLTPLADAVQDPRTMAWWAGQPDAWAYLQRDRQDPHTAMPQLVSWATDLPGTPVMVSYPSYDFMWMHWYILRFGGVAQSPFSFSALDIKTLAMVALKEPSFRATSKRRMKKKRPRWFDGQPAHDHTGLADAIGQGMLFVNILLELRAER